MNAELLNIFTDADGNVLSVISIISLSGWGLGYFGQPHILARFMAIHHPNQINQARIIAMVWVVFSLLSAVLLGLLGNVFLACPLESAKAETVFMVMVNGVAPPILAGFLLAAILAAIMSTADSQLLVTSSALTEDFYRMLFRKNAGDKELVWISRFAVVVVAVIAFFLALDPRSSVLKLVSFAWGGFGASFGPLIVLSLFWKRMTLKGAIAGIIVGGSTVLIWEQLQGGLFDVYEIVPGFIFAFVIIIAVSLMDKKPSQIVLDEFENVSTETEKNNAMA
jgi:sodium/proline symporter